MSATIRTESFRTADATVKVFTGDKSIAHPNRQSILELYVPVGGVSDKSTVCVVRADSSVRPDTVIVGELGRVNFDYTIYAVKPRGETIDATVHAPLKRYVWRPLGNMHDLAVQCVCTGPNDRERTTVGVGEQVNLCFEPALDFHNPQWTHAGGNLSTSPTVPANGTFYTASSNAATDKVMANFPKSGGGYVTLTTTFDVRAPTGVKTSIRGLAEFFAGPYPRVAAGMFIDVVLQPTTVSFNRVQVQEPGEPTTATGYFTQLGVTPPSHSGNGADEWHPVSCDNKVLSPPLNRFDHAWDDRGWPIGVSGTYTWPIHPVWRVGAADTTTDPLSGWTEQKFTLSDNGTMRIDKFGHHVIRGPNQERGTAQ
jgi:hypothetical protein